MTSRTLASKARPQTLLGVDVPPVDAQLPPDELRHLQQSIGNRALGRMLQSRGEAIEPRTRASLERALSSDLSAVRLHRDGPAAEATSNLGARALNIGQDIYLAPEAGDTSSAAGRAALAHEAVHVAQRNRRASQPRGATVSAAESPAEDEAYVLGSAIEAGGPARDVSMAPDAGVHRQDEEEQRRRDQTDRLAATMASTERAGLASLSTQILKDRALVLQQNLDRPEAQAGPRQRLEAARTLLAIRDILGARIDNPQAATPYSLESQQVLDQGGGGLDSIPPFEHAAEWQAMVDQAPPGEAAGPAPSRGVGRRQATEASPEATGPAAEAAPETPVEAAQAGEPAAAVGGSGGMPEVSAGLATAGAVSFRDLARVIAEMRGGGETPEGETPGGRAAGGAMDIENEAALSPALLSRVSHVLYLGTRFYILDRSGAIVYAIDPGVNVGYEEFSIGRIGGPEQFSMEPSWVGAEPGTYFLCAPRANGRPIGMVAARLDGGVAIGSETIVDFMPSGFRDVAAIGDLIVADLTSGNGVLVVVSQGTRGPEGETGDIPMDANFGNVATALDRVADTYLMPAIERELQRRVDNPVRSLGSEAFNFAWGWVQRRFPLAELVTSAFDIMERAAWTGRILSIICYARARDEIDIGAQAIAQRAAQESIAFLASQLTNAAGNIAGAAGRAARDRHNGDRAAAGDDTAPMPEGENGPFVPEPAAEAESGAPVQVPEVRPERLAELRQQWEEHDREAAAGDLEASAAPEAGDGAGPQQQARGAREAGSAQRGRTARPPALPEARDDARTLETPTEELPTMETPETEGPRQGEVLPPSRRPIVAVAEATPSEVLTAARADIHRLWTMGPEMHAWRWYQLQEDNAGRTPMTLSEWQQLGASQRPVPPVAFRAGDAYYIDTDAFIDALSPEAADELQGLIAGSTDIGAPSTPGEPATSTRPTNPDIDLSQGPPIQTPRDDRQTLVDVEAQQAGREQRPPDAGDPDAPSSARRGVGRPYTFDQLQEHFRRAFEEETPLTPEMLHILPPGQVRARFVASQGQLPDSGSIAGYVDPATGHIYISANDREPIVARIHEAIHAVAMRLGHREGFVSQFGSFLEEAVTQTVTEAQLGPAIDPVYTANMRFLAYMESSLQITPDTVRRAYMNGERDAFIAQLDRALGPQRRAEFLDAVRQIGIYAQNTTALAQARRIVSEAAVVASPLVPVGTPGEGVAE